MFTYQKLSNYVYLVSYGQKPAGEIYMGIDGFFVYDPQKGGAGFWSEENLLELGNKLKELNTPWKEQIENDLDPCKNCRKGVVCKTPFCKRLKDMPHTTEYVGRVK